MAVDRKFRLNNADPLLHDHYSHFNATTDSSAP